VAGVLRTVIVDSDAQARATVRQLLGTVSAVLVGEFSSVSEAIIEAPLRRADVALVGAASIVDAQRALRAVEQLARTLTDAAIVVIGSHFSADTVIGMMRAGAVEVIHWPLDRDELIEAFDTVHRSRHRTPPTRPVGEIVSVFAAKGGLGATSVATNVAVVLAERKAAGTLLVELDGRPSDVATLLNFRVTYSVLDAFRNIDRLDESFLRGLVARHDSGLWVLPGPRQYEPFTVAADDVRNGLELVRSHFDHVVLDVRHEPDPATLAALATSDTVLFLTSLNVAALRAGAAALTVFRDAGVDLAHVRVIVMREGASEDVTLAQAEDTLHARIAAKVVNDYPAAMAAINSGEPVMTRSPRSKVSKSIRDLVSTVVAPVAPVTTETRQSRPGRLLRHALLPKAVFRPG
jgi:pilus assembly protein CpaE